MLHSVEAGAPVGSVNAPLRLLPAVPASRRMFNVPFKKRLQLSALS